MTDGKSNDVGNISCAFGKKGTKVSCARRNDERVGCYFFGTWKKLVEELKEKKSDL